MHSALTHHTAPLRRVVISLLAAAALVAVGSTTASAATTNDVLSAVLPSSVEQAVDPVVQAAAPVTDPVTQATAPVTEPVVRAVQTTAAPARDATEPATAVITAAVDPVTKPVVHTAAAAVAAPARATATPVTQVTKAVRETASAVRTATASIPGTLTRGVRGPAIDRDAAPTVSDEPTGKPTPHAGPTDTVTGERSPGPMSPANPSDSAHAAAAPSASLRGRALTRSLSRAAAHALMPTVGRQHAGARGPAVFNRAASSGAAIASLHGAALRGSIDRVADRRTRAAADPSHSRRANLPGREPLAPAQPASVGSGAASAAIVAPFASGGLLATIPLHGLPARPGFVTSVRTPVAGLSPVRLASGHGSPG